MVASLSMKRKGKLLQRKQENLKVWHCNENIKQYKAESIAMGAGDTSTVCSLCLPHHNLISL